MSAPRQILPGATYMLTRRCAQRQYLLRPSKTTRDIVLYVLAVAVQRFGVSLHGFCFMSNHTHLVVTDPDARLPEFSQFLNAFIARAVNASLGRWEAFWAPGSYNAVRLDSPDDIVDKMAYTLANPVTDGLVRSARSWPGAWSAPDRIGGPAMVVKRPPGFFAEDGDMPPEAPLELTVPPGFESAEDFRARVVAALAEREEEAHELHGDAFAGVERVLKQSPFARPRSIEPRRNLKPRVAARKTGLRVEALRELVEFVRAYRRAWAARRAGDVSAVFPAGTYLLRVRHGAPCVGFG